MKALMTLLLVFLAANAFSHNDDMQNFDDEQTFETESFERKIKVNPKNYTCNQLNDLIMDNGSIWVRGFLGVHNNVALSNPHCSGAANNHPKKVCRYFARRVRASDGRCQLLGQSCSCSAPNDDDD